jgi:2-C-methyl-D-erythritol 2,4-cyclodiphosphate synthase
MYRVGVGYDIHRLKKGRPLFLGGVKIPFPRGLDGHSDADVLLHAIIDAVLGASGLPDIGSYFPPGDPKFKGISSRVMAATVVRAMKKQGFHIKNIDSVLVAEAPKLAPHRESLRKSVAKIFGVTPSAVQIKGKSNEGLDAVGQGKALAAHAVVLLQSKVNGRGR